MPFRLQLCASRPTLHSRVEVKFDLWSAGQSFRFASIEPKSGASQLLCKILPWNAHQLPIPLPHYARQLNWPAWKGKKKLCRISLFVNREWLPCLRDFDSRKRKSCAAFYAQLMSGRSLGRWVARFLLLALFTAVVEAKWNKKIKGRNMNDAWETTRANSFRGDNRCLGKMCECAQCPSPFVCMLSWAELRKREHLYALILFGLLHSSVQCAPNSQTAKSQDNFIKSFWSSKRVSFVTLFSAGRNCTVHQCRALHTPLAALSSLQVRLLISYSYTS